MPLNIPMFLTWLRIVLIPVFVGIFYVPWHWAAPVSALVFLLAAITDWADGYLARKWDQTSRFGAFLDPVADKLMVAAALVMLTQVYASPWLTVASIIIIGREITISALREWMAEVGNRGKVAVAFIGKLKTATQMVALVLLLYRNPFLGIDPQPLGFILLYVAALLTLVSMFKYLSAAFKS
ncbi:CDP-diacylglycerol--glycerol-3-phosphate 3-phosphatidyltransferase [Acidihalobacter ferrooxydans]|uniref:CDP-diacylglycerol--glycerol-3-phosphate 3-phosphatidyltransferase n=1 Tax=Acidihalobacter ferrooxydans TaxID=1765967 RepID=A0A1P8UL52_9GAMM|nr:CDP-diacylglycerol--glycerol-3-phosphate 3-phosphatidyltransferase [Acidihalobacter ferrooxydans]APZ44560.1 CDP-diacylglycerol--glycerol-3-phosphate 3-phosphatidyltransferase [Acidihalobacter ferrooxydans]